MNRVFKSKTRKSIVKLGKTLRTTGYYVGKALIRVVYDVAWISFLFILALWISHSPGWSKQALPKESLPYFFAIFLYLDLRRLIKKDWP